MVYFLWKYPNSWCVASNLCVVTRKEVDFIQYEFYP